MAIVALGDDLRFPDPEAAHPSGVVAVGGDLRPDRLLVAYSLGIFPWPAEGYPLLWHCPAERWVVAPPSSLRINRTLAKALRRHRFAVTLDTAFADVIAACARTPRPGQDGTWITPDVLTAYVRLHEMGFAHSVEVWLADRLVGGLYGVALGKAFFGESMFAWQDDASKVGFVTLCRQLTLWNFRFVDAQVATPLLESLGAVAMPRAQFLALVGEAIAQPVAPGRWRLDPVLAAGVSG